MKQRIRRKPSVRHFNKLTPAQEESLDLLAEECAEVIVAISKIKRHGLHTHHPFKVSDGTNAEQLENEVGDMMAAVDVVEHNVNDFARANAESRRQVKLRSLPTWLHHAKVPGQ